MGTLKFKITDDDGEAHDFEVPNSVYDAQGRHKLLCPQHWSRECTNIKQAYEMTGNKATTLAWRRKSDGRWYKKTVQHKSSRAPVPVLHTSSGSARYKAYCASINPADDIC